MHAIKHDHCVAIRVRYDEIPQPKESQIDIGMINPPNYDEPSFLRKEK